MKIIFMSSIYDMSKYDALCRKSKATMSLADHNLNLNIILGLEKVSGQNIQLVNNIPLASYPDFPQIFFRKEMWSHNGKSADFQSGFINLPVLKQLSRSAASYTQLKKLILDSGDEPVVVMTYDLHPYICAAIRHAKKVFPNIDTCAVLPDIPSAMVAEGGPVGGRKAKVRAMAEMRYIHDFDAYVFITKQMSEIVDVTHKPYTVVEGIYNNNGAPLAENNCGKKIILYSGMIGFAYKIDVLIEAFQKICAEHSDYELWLCGSGDAVDFVKKISEENNMVKYLGYLSTQKLRNCQAQAACFVNPRQNIGEYTKYSFPSKTMEYLALGRPVVGYRLDGFPEEYSNYIHYVEENTSDALAQKLIEVCELSKEERDRIGRRNRQFILEKKNLSVQCQKIYDMLTESL